MPITCILIVIFFNLYFQLFNAPLKVSNGQEKENLQSLNYDVSDKGNGAGVNKGKWVIRRPIWRSERASALMEQLQQQINDSQQQDLRQMSRHNVAWALADIEPATGGEHSEEEMAEDEKSSHSPSPEQHSTPVSIVQTCRGDKGKPRREHRYTPCSPTCRRLRRVIQSDSE